MEIFISWSGERSRAAAESLRKWLPKIVNAFKPWLSSSDIDKGSRWSVDVAGRLQAATAGIICLTPSNVHSDWILFEAGALSKTLANTYVCPLLIGMEPADLKGPLAQFQATRAIKEDMLKLVKTLNQALSESALPESHINEAFEVWWPKLEGELNSLPTEPLSANRPQRSERDLLEEILNIVRNQNRIVPPIPKPTQVSERQKEVMDAISRAVRPEVGIRTISVTGWDQPRLNCVLQAENGVDYAFTLPTDIDIAEVPSRVKLQISSGQEVVREEFQPGQRVRHPKYGIGTVFQRSAKDGDALITVQFPEWGLKKLVESHAGLVPA